MATARKRPDDAVTHLACHGWIAFTEAVVLRWARERTIGQDQLLLMVRSALPALVYAGR